MVSAYENNVNDNITQLEIRFREIISIYFFFFHFQSRRSPEFTLYREETTPEVGGKVPESAHMRLHLNQLDVVGIDDPNSSRMIEEMKDMHLPEKMDETSLQSLHTGSSSSYTSPYSNPNSPDSPYTSPNTKSPPSFMSEAFPSNFNDNFDSFNEFPFNPAFDAHKISSLSNNKLENDYLPYSSPAEFPGSGRGFGSISGQSGPNPAGFPGKARDYGGNSLDIYEQKPHLFTPDPYEQPDHYKPEPEPYTPPVVPDPAPHNPGYYEPEPYHPAPPATYHEPEPYHPAPPATYHEPEPYHPGPYHEPEPYHPPATYHEPEPYHPPSSYHEPEPYHPEPEPYHPPSTYHEPEPYHPEPYHPPPHSGYHEPEPYHPPSSDYGAPAPSSDYGAPKPYKPKAPVMLEKRPYEPKEIKPVTITTHEAYTGFDCRKVPYPDRHYADPEAGCSVSFDQKDT